MNISLDRVAVIALGYAMHGRQKSGKSHKKVPGPVSGTGLKPDFLVSEMLSSKILLFGLLQKINVINFSAL